VGRRKLESVNLKPDKNPMGKIFRKDYLSTAVKIAKLRDRGKTFYRDDNTAPYGIALLGYKTNEQQILYPISLISKRKAERLIVIDIDVAVQRRRDFALNRHLYPLTRRGPQRIRYWI
jgi:hypothetical protein